MTEADSVHSTPRKTASKIKPGQKPPTADAQSACSFMVVLSMLKGWFSSGGPSLRSSLRGRERLDIGATCGSVYSNATCRIAAAANTATAATQPIAFRG
jgi:hypothetical protein